MSGSSPTPATTQQTTKVELPAWVDQASQENYNLAKQVAGRPLEQYEGPTVADTSAMTQRGYDVLGSSVGETNPMYSDAYGLLTKAAGPLDIQSQLNPYTSEVEANAIRNANTALTQQLRDVSDAATKSRAFGGSRAAIESGVTRSEGIKGIGDLSAKLRAQGFDTATANALAVQAGQRATAGQLVSTAGAKQAATTQDIASLFGAGAAEKAQRQAVIDAAMKKFYEKRDYPTEQLNIRLAALGMSPYGRTETGYKTATSEDKGPDWATIGLGAGKLGVSALPYLLAMSDRRMKTDITKVTDGDIPMYAYRYKGDPKSYPKVVGPMAQDIEKKYPSAVKKVGKYKTIDLSNLMEVLS